LRGDRAVRFSFIGFGACYTLALALLGELLGSSADSTRTFSEHFDSATRRLADILGGASLLAAALALLAVGLSLRERLGMRFPGVTSDFLAALGGLSASGLLVSGGLLMAPALMRTLGEAFGDPGMEPGAAAGVAQAGTAVLVATLLLLGLMTAITVWLAARARWVTLWLTASGYVVAALTVLGFSIGAAAPLGVWWMLLGIFWRLKELPEEIHP
jgi:hypothetical protein